MTIIEPVNLPVRFFIYDSEADNNEGGFVECDEADFLDAEGDIEYNRHSVFENGVAQICLTKIPY